MDPAPAKAPDPAPKPSGSPLRPWLIFLIATLCALTTVIGYAVSALRPSRPMNQTTTVVRGSSPVVTAIRDLATLETASYHMERVIDLRDKQSHLFGLFESQDAVLLVAAADIVAGIDLSGMRDGDIVFDNVRHTARVTLPPPVILSAHLDNTRTYVHTRITDPLARRAEQLETRARLEAEQTLRDAAIEAGILQRARNNGARTIQTLVQSLGFTEVRVEFRAE